MQQQSGFLNTNDNNCVFANSGSSSNNNANSVNKDSRKKEMYVNEDIEKWSEDLDGWAYEI